MRSPTRQRAKRVGAPAAALAAALLSSGPAAAQTAPPVSAGAAWEIAGAAAASPSPSLHSARLERLAGAVGRLLVVGFHGARPSDPAIQALTQEIAAGRIGGVLLMGRNIQSPTQVRTLIAHLRNAAPGGRLAVLIDQEGGRVARANARNGFRNWPSARRAAAMDRDAAGEVFAAMAAALADLGVTGNLAPVVDLALEPRSSVIARAGRSFGADPDQVTALAARFLAAHRTAGVGACLKHFPGHGSVRGDTHRGPVSNAGRWRPELELAPYRRLAAWNAPARAGCVMTSHLTAPDITGPEGGIVTFSRAAMDLLRWDIGFDGVAITDDLLMRAATAEAPPTAGAVAALAAGHDLLLLSDWRRPGADAPQRFHEAARAALADGRLTPWRVEEALFRVDRWLDGG